MSNIAQGTHRSRTSLSPRARLAPIRSYDYDDYDYDIGNGTYSCDMPPL